jgi:hypothetical protein
MQPLAQRVIRDQAIKLADQFPVAAECQVCIDPGLGSIQP